ncbi:MAG: DNA recombination protein RmuC [Deltaproteobacteria bacterium]|nr:DNA recombination protein RmuC [Deltaproteobacteria bacterium]
MELFHIGWVAILAALVSGFILGLLAAWALGVFQRRQARELAETFKAQAEAEKKEALDAFLETVKATFGDLSLQALSRSTGELLKMAGSTLASERQMTVKELDARKGLIDQQIQAMTVELANVSKLVRDLEKDRVEKFGELSSQLQAAREQTEALARTTNTLQEALASTRVRGQWGERMAEDVLRLAGFVENVNYLKQKSLQNSGTRPDFTFLLPRDLTLNMDVKFPLDNYLRYLEADTEAEKARLQSAFLKDVRARIKEITTRDYINPEENTLDYVLLFIPNEQIYAFIQEQDAGVLDTALKNKVVVCSPLTLFAVLAVIRQAVDNFAVEQTSREILSLLGAFRKQWEAFVKKMDLLGKRISDAQKEYDALLTTRRRQLERPLDRIDELRERRGIEAAPPLMQDPGQGREEG